MSEEKNIEKLREMLVEVQTENFRLKTQNESYEKLLRSINDHYFSVQENLMVIANSIMAARKDSKQVIQALDDIKAAKKAAAEAGVQHGGTG